MGECRKSVRISLSQFFCCVCFMIFFFVKVHEFATSTFFMTIP